MQHIDAPLEEGRARSADGTELTYYRVGRGPRRWLMPPAMGAPLLCMKYFFERFADDWTIVTWDMRGFHRSGAPRDEEAYAVDDHVADLVAVRDAVGWRGAPYVLGGWSMAVQISLEHYRREPDDVRALVLINGPYERVLDAAMPIKLRDNRPIDALLTAGRRLGPAMNALSRRALGARWAAPALQKVGLLAANPELFTAVLADFKGIDWGRYLTVMRRLHEHSAAPHLGHVTVPALITAATKDRMTPVSTAEDMHRAIDGSELLVVEGGTHYVVVEYPDELTGAVARFFDRLSDESNQAALAEP
jgi:pimeloyl-ACP methyl ester carboxylesterase